MAGKASGWAAWRAKQAGKLTASGAAKAKLVQGVKREKMLSGAAAKLRQSVSGATMQKLGPMRAKNPGASRKGLVQALTRAGNAPAAARSHAMALHSAANAAKPAAPSRISTKPSGIGGFKSRLRTR